MQKLNKTEEVLVTPLKGEVSAEQVATWKALYRDVFAVSVADSVAYFRKVDRRTMSYISTIGDDAIKVAEAVVNNCWLGGDDNIKADDNLFMAVAQVLSDLVDYSGAEIKKL